MLFRSRLVVGQLQPSVAAATMPAWERIIATVRRRAGRLDRIARRLPGKGWTA